VDSILCSREKINIPGSTYQNLGGKKKTAPIKVSGNYDFCGIKIGQKD